MNNNVWNFTLGLCIISLIGVGCARNTPLQIGARSHDDDGSKCGDNRIPTHEFRDAWQSDIGQVKKVYFDYDSYGEERLADTGAIEESYALNRRCEFNVTAH